MQSGKDFWTSLYFIPLRQGKKIPAVKWGGYDQDLDEAEEVLRHSELDPTGYYGYMAHEQYQLGVVDIDIYKDEAPDVDDVTYHDGAMVIKTPGGGFHFPFLIPEGDPGLEVRNEFSDWVDLKGEIANGHAVLPFGSDYEIVQDGEVRLYSTVDDEHESIVKVNDAGVLERSSSGRTWSGECPYQSVYNLLHQENFPPGERAEHPFHGSSTGSNFMVDENEETWRCWRHRTTGNLLHLLGIHWDVLQCGEWDDKSYEELHDKYEAIKRKASAEGIALDKRKPQTMTDAMDEVYG